MKRFKKPYIFIPAAWSLLPWVFALIYQFHKPDHADVIWLPLAPLVFLSFIPAFLHGGDPGLGSVFISSLFNGVIGGMLGLVIFWCKESHATPIAEDNSRPPDFPSQPSPPSRETQDFSG